MKRFIEILVYRKIEFLFFLQYMLRIFCYIAKHLYFSCLNLFTDCKNSKSWLRNSDIKVCLQFFLHSKYLKTYNHLNDLKAFLSTNIYVFIAFFKRILLLTFRKTFPVTSTTIILNNPSRATSLHWTINNPNSSVIKFLERYLNKFWIW